MDEAVHEEDLLKEDYISELIAEPKYIPFSKKSPFEYTIEKNHRKSTVILEGKHQFKMHIRQSIKDPLNFSVILLYASSAKNASYRILVRYKEIMGFT
ncbi:hypothetical protein [Candidatus Methanomassiliicoccus intestinalis]|mgnify:CR=1 FL=1|uniref:hypothetical protein n=2 Tax=Candidatus Methanomassiliicoccus intestinalis TaxID=1406512 RepID=UPI0037DDD9DB